MEEVLEDERFKHIVRDPRFRSVPKRERKVKVDDRFRSMFTDKQFKVEYAVDKRGRPHKQTSSENLRKFYQQSSSSSSSDEEEDEEVNDDAATPTTADTVKQRVESGEAEKEIDYARGEGNIETSSSSSEDEDEDDEDEETTELIHPWGELAPATTTDEATRRLAVCNMDWDRISAQDIYFLCKSFAPVGGVIKSVKIYLSDFGRQRLELEEVKGPAELIETRLEEEDEDENPDVDPEGEKYHMEKLRQYQLNRLNYYYAVVECDCVQTAAKIYDECDGLDFESSASKLDLRYIPDDMEFNDEAHSSADVTLDGSSYRPKYFTTTALQSSRVKLTWDETNPNRIDVIHRAFDKEEEEDMEVKAYLASTDDDDDDGEAEEKPSAAAGDESDASENGRGDGGISKYKALLEAIDKEEEKKKDKDVHLEITWGPGLKEKAEELIQKKAKEKEVSTPWEEYLSKKKEKRKQKLESKKQSAELEVKETEDGNPYSDDEIPSDIDLDDPYFKEESDKVPIKKKKGKTKPKKLEENIISPDEDQKKAELSLLLMEDDHKKHFSLRKLIKNADEKKKKKKKKLKKEEPIVDDGFEMNLNDPRFAALYTSHAYNIDPSEPHFKKTKGIEKVMEEKQKRRMNQEEVQNKKSRLVVQPENPHQNPSPKVKEKAELSSLVKSIKSKTKHFNQNTNKSKR